MASPLGGDNTVEGAHVAVFFRRVMFGVVEDFLQFRAQIVKVDLEGGPLRGQVFERLPVAAVLVDAGNLGNAPHFEGSARRRRFVPLGGRAVGFGGADGGSADDDVWRAGVGPGAADEALLGGRGRVETLEGGTTFGAFQRVLLDQRVLLGAEQLLLGAVVHGGICGGMEAG